MEKPSWLETFLLVVLVLKSFSLIVKRLIIRLFFLKKELKTEQRLHAILDEASNHNRSLVLLFLL